MKNILFASLKWIGATLLIISLLGQFSFLSSYRSANPRSWETFDPLFVASTPTFNRLLTYSHHTLDTLGVKSSQATMDILFKITCNRFTHFEARHSVFSNWILFTAGLFVPKLSHIFDVRKLVRDGNSGLCDQVSFVLVQLALENGIRARHVGLEGHVVMEAWYEGDWHMYDPDMEIVPADPGGTILSVDALSRSDSLLDNYYAATGFVDIIKSRENNNFVSTPVGCRFDWLNSMWVYVEKTCDILKFLVPALMLITVVPNLNKRRK